MKNKKPQIDFTVDDKIINNLTENAKKDFFTGGKEKAAKLLIAFGPELASQILKELNEDEVVILIEEMLRIRKISEKDKKELIEEFYASLKQKNFFSTGTEEAKKILLKTFDEEKAKEILRKARNKDIQKEIQFIENFEPSFTASILQEEHPQIISVILSLIKPSLSANILKFFPTELRIEVIKRISDISYISPESLEKIINSLKSKFEKKSNEVFTQMDGIQSIVSIFNHLDRKYENELLEYLENYDKELYEKIKAKLYSFEELINLNFEELRILLSKIDTQIIAHALLGLPEEFKRTFLNALSQNKASDVIFELDVTPNLPIRKIMEARNHIMNIAKELDSEGKIIIKKEKEDFFKQI